MKTFSLRALIVAIAMMVFAPPAAHAAGPFDNWAGVFIAGDFRAHSGADSEVFDNGRRDVAKAFVDAGLKKENTVQFSVRPELYADTPEKPFASRPGPINDQIDKVTDKAKDGCVFFMTSHGSPDGIVVGNILMRPSEMARLLDKACGKKPTLVIVSSCFSGVFVPMVAAPNRVVMTAARPDRSSFGCGESDTYTFFDTCLLQELPAAGTFDVLANNVRGCVEKRETELGMRPPSEPQSFVGEEIKGKLSTYALAQHPPTQVGAADPNAPIILPRSRY